MNHRGRGWVLGAMGLQLVACGSARQGSDSDNERELARPERAAGGADRVVDEGLAMTASVAHSSALAMVRQRGGRLGPANPEPVIAADPEGIATPDPEGGATPDPEGAAAAEPEPAAPEPEPEPVAPDPGWEAAHCAGAATRHVRVVGNLDAEASVPPWFVGPFDAEKPWNTSAFSTTFGGVDDQARFQMVTIYFQRREQGWDYHALMEGTALVVGQGHLSFDEQGAVTVEETQPLQLLTASGPGHAVELDLSGMTQLAEPCNIVLQEVDGAEARWGNACAAVETIPEAETVAGPQCAAAATTRLTLRANLSPAAPMANEPWDPLAPTAGLTLFLQANDAYGTPIDFELHLRRSSVETWDYHAVLMGEVPGLEVAGGSLHFNANGSLHSVTTVRSLTFPNRNGERGDFIELDFGTSTTAGGSGVDGVTSLPGGTFGVWQQRDGAVLDCLPRASADPLPVWHSASCAGERTTAVWMGFNLDPSTALGDATAYSASAIVYDAALTPHELELRFRHVAEQRWQCQVLASSTEIGVVDLHFASNGAPELIENIPVLRFPLADGSAGPPVQLAFDDGWSITSFASATSGWLGPNGAPPQAEGCAP